MERLLFILILFTAGCGKMDDPSPVVTPIYTMEPGAIYAITGRLWNLEGIYNLVTGEMRTLDAGADGECYSMIFDTDSTANGNIGDSDMTVSLRRPFFAIHGGSEEDGEAKLFTKVASAISGCEYILLK
ncbi:MAG: hypothetical protein LBI58_00455 [Tannerellaceae bacterium]|jgi:hypothetical protein|nr:hypothetical protein [Tannerellaceae bacterium]